MKRFAITDWCHKRIHQMMEEENVPGNEKQRIRLIDATAGTGKDTQFLCHFLGEREGEILAMDIQEMALLRTKRRLQQDGYVEIENDLTEENRSKRNTIWANLTDKAEKKNIRLVLRGHEYMDAYFPAESVDVILFNLGYLPGGDHNLATKPETTLCALEKALRLLKVGGLLSIVIYSGGDSGFEEKEQVLSWLQNLDASRYLVLVEQFYNRPNHPPLPVFIRKLAI